MALLALFIGLATFAQAARAELPDGRGYELVTPVEMNGVIGSIAYPSPDGDVVDWSGLGACCGSSSGAEELFQSRRGPDGWTTRGLTPTPKELLEGFSEGQVPSFWSRDLATSIFNTPETYDPGDREPGTLDLYAVGADGIPRWLSQGPLSGTATPSDSTFDGADPEGRVVLFSTTERLTPDATPLSEEVTPAPQYLYARDLRTGTTQLVNVADSGAIINADGAILGDGSYVGHGTTAPDQFGSTTDAVSADAEKVFFESPPPDVFSIAGESAPHLYMRDLGRGTTTPLDDPSAAGSARYEGASEDGSLVFFRSDEGLGGSAADLELYAFNTTESAIGVVPAMSAVPISDGDDGTLDGHLLGISAISNDGSHVFFVAEGVLTAEPNGLGQTAQTEAANFYSFDTATGTTAFIATLGPEDIIREVGLSNGPLIEQPDLARPAVPTPDGSVLVFESKSDLTGENPEGPATTLAVEAEEDTKVIEVVDATGMLVGRQVQIGQGFFGEKYAIKAIRENVIELSRPIEYSQSAGTRVGQLSVSDIYRYEAGELICISCIGVGVAPLNASALTGTGGSYAPANLNTTMSADGSQIFFMSPEILLPEAGGPSAIHVYEWEGGRLYLLSEPHSPESAFVFGSTPSGNDVYLTTGAQLVPEVALGRPHTYDVRVGGGFPPQPQPPETCTGSGCPRTSMPPVPIPEPQTTGAAGPNGRRPRPAPPSFRLTTPGRVRLARSVRRGRLPLTVTAAAPGKVSIRAFAPLGPGPKLVAHSRLSFTTGHLNKRTTLVLSGAARERLAAGPLALTIEIRDLKTGELAIEKIDLDGRAGRHAPRRNR